MDRGDGCIDTMINRGRDGEGSVIKQREVYMKITGWGNGMRGGLTKDF